MTLNGWLAAAEYILGTFWSTVKVPHNGVASTPMDGLFVKDGLWMCMCGDVQR